MMGRLPCCIPGCRCTTGKPFSEWICSKHWRLVPKSYKRVYSRVKRRVKAGRAPREAAYRIWDRCKRHATDARFSEWI